MPYIVTRRKPRDEKMKLEDILYDLIDDKKLAKIVNGGQNTTSTTVHYVEHISREWRNKTHIYGDLMKLEQIYEKSKSMDIFFNKEYNYERQLEVKNMIRREAYKSGRTLSDVELAQLIEEELQKEGLKYNTLYRTFYIPKRSGSGMRRIDAPCKKLANVQRELKEFFEDAMGQNTYHTSAFAYIKGRSTADLARKLRANRSRWFLKLDFSNFFGSIDIDFTMRQLVKIFPFSEYVKYSRGYDTLYNCLKLCFLDGKLPQGTPFSPTLTNILMIPLDYEISNTLYNNAQLITDFDKEKEDDDKHFRLIYTRYADDIYIGAHRGFRYKPVIDYIRSVIDNNNAPFVIKPEKTRYSSYAGANWILGLMYNQNYDITIGSAKKKQISAMVFNFCKDYQNGIMWDKGEVQSVFGNISYLGQIEPKYRKDMIKKYMDKFGFNPEEVMKEIM